MAAASLIDVQNISKQFGSVIALSGVSMAVLPAEVHCLLGDNGAGKSTLIKTLSGVHAPSAGQILIEGQPVTMTGPRDALDRGIATVFQDLAMIPLDEHHAQLLHGPRGHQGHGPDAALRHRDREPGRARGDEEDRHRRARPDPGRGHALGRRAAVRGDRARGLFRRQGADPGRADLGAGRQAGLGGAEVRGAGPGARAWASSSSPTTSTTPGRWATSSPCSTAARRWARTPRPASPARSCST